MEGPVAAEISDGVKVYLEQLIASHERNLLGRFEASESKLLDKIGAFLKARGGEGQCNVSVVDET